MSKILNIQNPDAMHHAYVVQGAVNESRQVVLDFLDKKFSMDLANPDLSILDRADIGVDDVQEIININIRKSISSKKFIVISASGISHQAQNSLLKTLEEPRPGTYIFLLLHTASILLPTVLSRVQVVSLQAVPGEVLGAGESSEDHAKHASSVFEKNKAFDIKETAMDFTEAPIPARLELVKEILKEKEEERIGSMEIQQFVELVEGAVLHKIDSIKDTTAQQKYRLDFAKISVRVGEYIYDASSSKKMLLEYLALGIGEFQKI